MAQALELDRRGSDHVVALSRLFTEALNARDHEATRALMAEDVELRGLIHTGELFRTAVFRVRDGAITSYETLRND
jgi:ketosteroid isomerase-like protein